MLSKITYGVAATHIITASALKLTTEREPLLTWSATPPKAAYPKDYFVPNFGLDHDVINTSTDIKVAEGMLSHKLDIDTSKKKGPPQNYFVPNFGMDHDIATSIQNEKESSSTWNHKWVVPAKSEIPAPPPKDYFVPNFGLDHDILNTATDIKVAEAQIGHQWQPDLTKKKGPPQDYFVPNFGVDHDIADSLKHLNQQESIHGKWELPESMVQLNSQVEREPLLTWSETPAKAAYPKDYFVPNFGLDHDVINTSTDINVAEGMLSHKLDIDTSKKKGPPLNYFVPNFGMDHEIATSISNLNEAEKTNGKWSLSQTQAFGSPPEKAMPLNLAEHNM